MTTPAATASLAALPDSELVFSGTYDFNSFISDSMTQQIGNETTTDDLESWWKL